MDIQKIPSLKVFLSFPHIAGLSNKKSIDQSLKNWITTIPNKKKSIHYAIKYQLQICIFHDIIHLI